MLSCLCSLGEGRLQKRTQSTETDLEAVHRNRERHHARRDTAWAAFASRLGQRELPRLALLDPDWTYRLPPPGAVVEDDTLRASVALPGLPIRYTTDGTRPTASSSRYEGPVTVPDGATIRLRTFDGQGRGSRTIVVRP